MTKKELKHLSIKDREAVQALCLFIQQQVKVKKGAQLPDVVNVYAYYDNPNRKIGIRVAEVSMVWKAESGIVAGSSYMRTDVEGGDMCLRAEDFILEFHTKAYTPDGWDASIDMKSETEERLLYALNGSFKRKEQLKAKKKPARSVTKTKVSTTEKP